MIFFQNLFNRRGGINGRAYWLHCAVLLCVGIVLHMLAFGFIYAVNPDMLSALSGAAMVAITFGLIALLFYPYLCLYTKRLRDAGVSVWWYLVVFVVYWALYFIAINTIDMLGHAGTPSVTTGQMGVPPTMTEEATVALIMADVRRTLISFALRVALLHGVITIGIDVVLGKMKPRQEQDAIAPHAVLA